MNELEFSSTDQELTKHYVFLCFMYIYVFFFLLRGGELDNVMIDGHVEVGTSLSVTEEPRISGYDNYNDNDDNEKRIFKFERRERD